MQIVLSKKALVTLGLKTAQKKCVCPFVLGTCVTMTYIFGQRHRICTAYLTLLWIGTRTTNGIREAEVPAGKDGTQHMVARVGITVTLRSTTLSFRSLKQLHTRVIWVAWWTVNPTGEMTLRRYPQKRTDDRWPGACNYSVQQYTTTHMAIGRIFRLDGVMPGPY